MLDFLFRAKVDPAEVIGPDGMTDFSRELHSQWERRDRVVEKIHAEVANRTGIDADLVPHMPYEFLTLAVLLGVKLDD